MTERYNGTVKLYGFSLCIITAVHADEGWFQYRRIEAQPVDEKRFGSDLYANQNAAELHTDGIEAFFPIDGGDLDEVSCVDPKNIQPGRFVTCYELSRLVELPEAGSSDEVYRKHFREFWLGHQATSGDVVEYLQGRAVEILESKTQERSVSAQDVFKQS